MARDLNGLHRAARRADCVSFGCRQATSGAARLPHCSLSRRRFRGEPALAGPSRPAKPALEGPLARRPKAEHEGLTDPYDAWGAGKTETPRSRSREAFRFR